MQKVSGQANLLNKFPLISQETPNHDWSWYSGDTAHRKATISSLSLREIHLSTSYLLEASILLTEVRDTNRVMKNPVCSIIIRIWSPHNADHRKVLTVSSSYGIDHTQTSHGEGHSTCTHSMSSCVSVSCVTGIEFIATSDQLQPRFGH